MNVGVHLRVFHNCETPQQSIITKSNDYTVMEIPAFTGEVIMCAIILTDVEPNDMYTTGFNGNAEKIIYWLDDNFTENNTGEEKIF